MPGESFGGGGKRESSIFLYAQRRDRLHGFQNTMQTSKKLLWDYELRVHNIPHAYKHIMPETETASSATRPCSRDEFYTRESQG